MEGIQKATIYGKLAIITQKL